MDDHHIIEISSAMFNPPVTYTQAVKTINMEVIEETYYAALAAWEYHYGIGGDMHPESLTRNQIVFDMKLHHLEGPNWVKVIPPCQDRGTMEMTSELEEPKDWFKDMLKDIDIARFPSYNRTFFEEHVWYNQATPVVSSLQALVLRRLSLYNYTSADSQGKLVASSTSNLRPFKVPLLIKKYAQPVHKGVEEGFKRRCLTNGVILLNNIMGTVDFYENLFFEYSFEEFRKTPFPSNSSSGIRMGRNSKKTIDDMVIRTIVNGRKGVQAPYAFGVVDQYVTALRDGKEPTYPERCCKVAFKYEIVDCMWSFGEARLVKYLKCREFFIAHFVDFLIATMVYGYRMLIERGNTICIGLKWWYGGAHEFATELGYGKPDISYSGGDIKGQDYTTHAWALGLFSASGLAYVNPHSPDYKVYKKMAEACSNHLEAKFVNFTKNMWRWVVGTMPSGHAVTSHGNSWILAMYWWSYVYGVHERNPRAKILIRSPTGWAVSKAYFIRFKVYGDNHVVALSAAARVYLSYSDFVEFMNVYGVTIHDIQENVPLISVPDAAGGLKREGIVFLKRYLIETDVQGVKYVLPYKKWKDMAPKIAYGNSKRKNEYDILLAINGLAWDTMGTNNVLYKILLTMHCTVRTRIATLGLKPLASYLATYNDTRLELEKRARKIAISLDDYLRFPTQKELVQRHVYNEDLFTYRKIPEPRGCVWVDDIVGRTYKNRYTAN